MPTGKHSNKGNSTVLVPTSNAAGDVRTIMPDRFNSVSRPSAVPIVQPELNSVSAPCIGTNEYKIAAFK